MAIFRHSLFTIIFLSSCAHSTQLSDVDIDNQIEGCFTLKNWQLDTSKEPVILRASFGPENKKFECPCKSALVKYSVTQKIEISTSYLLTGNFTSLGKDYVNLPIAVQKQLIFSDIPLHISLTCAHL